MSDAAQAVAYSNKYIDLIKLVHKYCSADIDWQTIKKESAPAAPGPNTENEQIAQYALVIYQPGFLVRLFKREPIKIRRLVEAVLTARQCDEQLTKERQDEYLRQREEWREHQDICRQVLAKNSNVYAQVMSSLIRFKTLGN